MDQPNYIYKCNGFEPVCASNSQDAALKFAQAKAREVCGLSAYVERINLEEFSSDGRIERYTADLRSGSESRHVWLCVTRGVRVAEESR
jgi:hypothetical protein